MAAPDRPEQAALPNFNDREMVILRGTIDAVTYRAADSSFTVAKIRQEDSDSIYSIVGELISINPGDPVVVHGEWMQHKVFGQQLRVSQMERIRPATKEAIEKFLASGAIKGFGEVTAKRIVAKFGEETLDIIEKDPEKLREVPGLGKKRIDSLVAEWREQSALRHTMLRLQTLGITPSNAARIYKVYGSDSIRIVENYPYQLTYDIWGIGFKTADQIAAQIGFKPEDPRRIEAGVVHVLNEAVTRGGNTFVYRQDLVASAGQILESDGVDAAIGRLSGNGMVVVEPYIQHGERQEAVYPPYLHRAEVNVSEQIKRLASANSLEFDAPIDPETIDIGGALTDQQKSAVVDSLTKPILIVTGGPGVGKTTTTRAIVTAFEAHKKRVLLASPTGRAAKRLAEVTGREAKTLHRLLEYDPTTRGFKRNNQNPLACDLLVVDEASMLDINLTDSLLSAVPEGAHLLIIGDVDQLPSVGPGNVLRDLIESGVVPVARLTQIFRQAEASRIVTNAHRINQGEMPVLSLPSDKEDFVFIESDTAEETASKAVAVVARSLPNRGYSPTDIQVLTPMQKGDAGAVSLNIRLQAALNPERDGQGTITRGGRTFREGDRVMQIVNNYDRSVYNGDIGTIKSINVEEGILTVKTPEADVAYEFTDLEELVLAYASTIHKSQGSEFPVVVVLIHMQHSILLQRNLIYTALTRARKMAVFVGSKRAINFAVRTQSEINRNTRLRIRLQGLI